MKFHYRVLIAVAALMLTAGAAMAHVGPPMEIKLTSEFKPAVAGEPYRGTLTITVTGEADMTNFRLVGASWRQMSVKAPARFMASKGQTLDIEFQATPTDPDQPLMVYFDVGDHAHRKVLDLSPANYARTQQAGETKPAPVMIPNPVPYKPGPDVGVAGIPTPDKDYGDKAMITVHGRFSYLRTDGLRDGARSMRVEARDYDSDSGDELLGYGYTDHDGNYSFTVDGGLAGSGDTPDIYIHFSTQNLKVFVRNPTSDNIYGWSTGVTYNVTASDFDVGSLQPDSEDDHPAIHQFTTGGRIFTWAYNVGGYNLPAFDILWPDGDEGAWFSPGTNNIHISSDREWQEGTLAHEVGHYWDDTFSGLEPFDYCNGWCDTGGCGHCFWCEESPVIAWMEGWAQFFSIASTHDFLDLYGVEPFSQKEAEVLLECGTWGFHDPELTEGFMAALMLDIYDDNLENDPQYPLWHDSTTLGLDEIMIVADNDNPDSPTSFMDAFNARYPALAEWVWQSAANNGYDPDYATPGTVSSLTSSHSTVGDSPDPTIQFNWTRPTDDVSGVDGYGIYLGGAAGMPGATVDLGQVTSYTTPALAPGTYYFSIRSKDRSGRWGSGYASYGPVTIRAAEPADLTYYKTDLSDYTLVPSNETTNTTGEAHVSATLDGNMNTTYLTVRGLNQGDEATTAGFRVGFYYDDDYKYGLSWGVINAGGHYGSANRGPMIVKGGRHTLHAAHDDLNAISEDNEGNNVWGHQFIWTGLNFTAGMQQARATPPYSQAGWDNIVDGSVKWYNVDGLSFTSSAYWSAMVMWPYDTNDNFALRLHEGSTGSEDGYAANVGYSARAAGLLDAVIVNRNVEGSNAYDVGVLNTPNHTGNYTAELVTQTFHSFGDSTTYNMAAGHHLQLFEFWVAAADTGYVSLIVDSEEIVTGLWLDETFGTGPLTGFDDIGLWADGRARMEIHVPDSGYNCLVVYRDPVNGSDSFDFTVEIQQTPPDFMNYWAAGWHAPVVPRPADDGTGALVALPDTLHGNAASTFLNIAVRNESPTGTPNMSAHVYLDDNSYVSLGYGAFGGYVTSLFNWDYALTVRGGRHTFSGRLDYNNTYEEIHETNNNFGEQFVWSPLPMNVATDVNRSFPPTLTAGWDDIPQGTALWYNCDGLRVPRNSYWTALAVMPTLVSADVNVRLHHPAGGTKDGFKSNEGTSGWGPGQSDFVLTNYNVADSTPMDMGVLGQSGSGNYVADMVNSTFMATVGDGSYGPFGLAANQMLNLHEVYLNSGFYTFRLENLSGAVDWGISLMENTTEYGTKSGAMPDGAAWFHGDGQNESITVEAPADGYYCLAVWKVGTTDLAKAGTYNIRTFTGFTPVEDDPSLPQLTRLTGAHPNPFNPQTTLSFDLAKSGPVELNIYNVQGALITTLVSENMGPGRHTVIWDGTDRRGQRVSSDVYLARLVTAEAKEMKKLVLLK